MADNPDGYEVAPDLDGEPGSGEILSYAYTPNNGIRLVIKNIDEDDGQHYGAVFDMDYKQAALIGAALLRWAAASRAAHVKAEQWRRDHIKNPTYYDYDLIPKEDDPGTAS